MMDLSKGPPTREELHKNPSLLLHKRHELEGQEIQAFDGLVGAVIEGGDYIVTSPNMRRIYHPPLGGDRSLYLRSNLRYGDDDPLMWPQNFLPTSAHLPLIPYPPRDPNDPMRVLWTFPTEADFVREGSLLDGLGRVSGYYIACLRVPCRSLITRAAADEHKSDEYIQTLAAMITSFLDRLSYLPTSLRMTQLLVRETQRMALELTACLDLAEIYKPRLLHNAPAESNTKPARIIGAFTTSIQTCEDLFRAKIPVYLVRPATEVMSIRVLEVVTPIVAQGVIPLDEAVNPTYKAIYRGRVSRDKYAAMYMFTRRLQTYPNPFGLTCVAPRTEPLPAASSFVNRNSRAQQYSPYARRTKPKSAFYEPQGRDKFEDPDDPVYPPPIPAWRAALRNVDRTMTNVVNAEQAFTDHNYAFPEPASFVAYEKKERRDAAIRSWLRYRTALIHRFNISTSDARPMSGKAWRTLLGLDYLEQGPSKLRTDTKNAGRRASLQDFLQNVLEMDGLTLNSDSIDPVTWQGKSFESLGNQDIEEILWELAELNFRQELLALDCRVCPPPNNSPYSTSRQQMVSACFPSGQLLVATLPEANHGIASYDSKERCRYLIRLQRLMRDWPGQKPQIFSVDQVKWREGDIDELEEGIARFYTQTFFNHFRRAPVIPRRLSHNVPGLVLPPPALEHLNPTPMVYYDMDLILEHEAEALEAQKNSKA
ncbi:hypothetical protein LshimejAT787_0600730 [Lyophyllum shimeji]|uniref:Uncharacterized protein n=2 Tax=Lyophyllum shimeji TaxID=47721 RepID=A0A9P3PP92_LYOSH|nr:hypothetical protein LshimejAT787_0600730 [Lyophyllum shimeji]